MNAPRLATTTSPQGGDWGGFVVDWMGVQELEGLQAIHNSMPGTVPADVDKASVGEDGLDRVDDDCAPACAREALQHAGEFWGL
jgi:hypothetical protein